MAAGSSRALPLARRSAAAAARLRSQPSTLAGTQMLRTAAVSAPPARCISTTRAFLVARPQASAVAEACSSCLGHVHVRVYCRALSARGPRMGGCQVSGRNVRHPAKSDTRAAATQPSARALPSVIRRDQSLGSRIMPEVAPPWRVCRPSVNITYVLKDGTRVPVRTSSSLPLPARLA